MVPRSLGLKICLRNDDRILGGIVEKHAGEDDGISTALNKAAHFAVNLCITAQHGGGAGFLVWMDVCVLASHADPGKQTTCGNGMTTDECMVLANSSTSKMAVSHCCGMVLHDGLLGNDCVFHSDGIIEYPAGALLGKVALALYESTELAGLYIFTERTQCLDAVKLGVQRVDDVCDFVFFHRASPRTGFGFFVGCACLCSVGSEAGMF